MAWWRGDDRSHSNDKLLAVGLLGTGLHFRAVSWCATHETDGRLPVSVIPSLSPTLTPGARTKLVKAMATAVAPDGNPLWLPEENLASEVVAYWVHDFLEYNPSHEQLVKKRETTRRRLGVKRGAS